MKRYIKRIISLILAIAMFVSNTCTVFAETGGIVGNSGKSISNAIPFEKEVTWAEAGKQIAGMLGYIVEDAADIDL